MDIEQINAIVEDYHENHESYGDVWPTFVNLAKKLEMTQSELFELARDNEDLDHALEMMKGSQYLIATNKGLAGEMVPSLTLSIIYRQGYAKKYNLNPNDVELL